MPSKRITQETAERARPGADKKTGEPKDSILWDSGLKGFGLICRKNGETKTWILQREVQGKTARQTIGHFPAMGASEGRKEAEKVTAKMKEGFNPHVARAADLTLGVAFDKYLTVRVDLAESTRRLYRDNFGRYVANFRHNEAAKPMKETPLYELGKALRSVVHPSLGDARGCYPQDACFALPVDVLPTTAGPGTEGR